MEAGQAAGGDKRGRQSASLTVYGEEDYALLDLQGGRACRSGGGAAARVHGIARLQLTPFVAGMPKEERPAVAPTRRGDPDAAGAAGPAPGRRAGARAEPLDLVRRPLGIDLPPERLAENLAAFARILEEIGKLRKLDLTDIHPSVVFDPTAPYRREPGA